MTTLWRQFRKSKTAAPSLALVEHNGVFRVERGALRIGEFAEHSEADAAYNAAFAALMAERGSKR